VLSTRAGGGDHGATFAGVTTFFRPPVRRMEIGMLMKVGATVVVLAPGQSGAVGPTVGRRLFIKLSAVACGSKMPSSRTIPLGACVELKSTIGRDPS
jgi:hypothetical protein